MKTAAMLTVMSVLVSTRTDDLKLGEVVPDIEMKTLDGKDIKLSDFRANKEKDTDSKVVVIYFQSVRCPSALKPKLVKEIVAKVTGEKTSVEFLAVFAYGRDKEDVVKGFCEKQELEYPCIYDAGKKIARHLGAKKVNTTYVLDREGKLIYRGGLTSKKEDLAVEAVRAALDGEKAPDSDGAFGG